MIVKFMSGTVGLFLASVFLGGTIWIWVWVLRFITNC